MDHWGFGRIACIALASIMVLTVFGAVSTNGDEVVAQTEGGTEADVPGMISDLALEIQGWDLEKGVAPPLVEKLLDARNVLLKGNENGAVHKLGDFVSTVDSFVRNSKLTSDQGQYCIDRASDLMTLIKGYPLAVIDAPTRAEVGQEVQLDGSGSLYTEAPIVGWDWTIEQTGARLSGMTVVCEFETTGIFEIALHIEDSEGRESSAAASIEVVPVEIPPIELTPPYSDHAIDADADGLYELLAIGLSVTVNQPGDYTVNAVLSGPNGEGMPATGTSAYFTSGPQSLELYVPGYAIYNAGIDGPYLVTLYAQDGAAVLDTDTFYTQEYSWYDFTPAPVILAETASDHALDSNDDGIVEQLAVDVSFDVTVSGIYSFEATLYGGSVVFSAIATAHWMSAYEPGTGLSVQFQFAGSVIRDSGLDGPYTVVVIVRNETRMVDTANYLTGPYSHDLFGAAFVAHAPISIVGDIGFTALNGVTGGSGTADDPYVIAGWSIDASAADGIRVSSTSKYFVIRNMEIVNGGDGKYAVRLDHVSHAAVETSRISNFACGIIASYCSDLSLRANIVDQVGLFATVGLASSDVSVIGNSVSGYRPSGGWYDGIRVQDSANVLVSGNTISDNDGVGVLVYNCVGVVLEHNAFSACWGGFQLGYNDGLRVAFNSVQITEGSGMLVWNSGDASIQGNWVTGSGESSQYYSGIDATALVGASVTDNTVFGFQWGIGRRPGMSDPTVSTGTLISGNRIDNNNYGLYLDYFSGTTVVDNVFVNNNVGIDVASTSTDTQVYHNDFVTNYIHAIDGVSSVWDDGYPSGGNYWSGFTDVDSDNDGIWDHAYVIDGDSLDHYPLVHPLP